MHGQIALHQGGVAHCQLQCSHYCGLGSLRLLCGSNKIHSKPATSCSAHHTACRSAQSSCSQKGKMRKLDQQQAWSRRQQLVGGLFAAIALQPQRAMAMDQELARTQAEYDRSAGSYNRLDGGAAASLAGFPEMRRELLSKASGAVLEVAVGTGLNLPLYDASRVESYTGVDLSPGMLAQARSRLSGLQNLGSAALQQGNVESLPFEDDTFDSVVSTFSLCVFSHPGKALHEMARVLKRGGQMLLLEHSRSKFAPLAWYQDLTAQAVAATSKGCVWNQDLQQLLATAELRTTRSKTVLGGLVTLIEAELA